MLTFSFCSVPEVLKHVWELSDQDNDTMLSLREFCISLYLMERYREGRPLPTALPSSIMFDETLLSISGAPSHGYANAGWGSGQGIAHVSCILVIFSFCLILFSKSDFSIERFCTAASDGCTANHSSDWYETTSSCTRPSPWQRYII